MLFALLPGMTRREKDFIAELLRSRRIPAFCFVGPWQSRQLSWKRGMTSFTKSTFAGACADNPLVNTDKPNTAQMKPNLTTQSPRLIGNRSFNARHGISRLIDIIVGRPRVIMGLLRCV